MKTENIIVTKKSNNSQEDNNNDDYKHSNNPQELAQNQRVDETSPYTQNSNSK
jgi:hypothetical protein